jgi:uncharacterized protein (DUF2164 family)
MSEITLAKEEVERVVDKLKKYFTDELYQDIGRFDAEFLIDFFAKEIGPSFYNRGLADAHVLLMEKSEEMGYLIQDLEKPTR